LPHILGIKSRRQGRGAGEIAKHDSQLTALSRIVLRGAHDSRGSRRLILIAQACNRLENTLSRSKRQAQLFEIGLRQFRQNISLDFTLAKGALVLSKPETP
jgi:hypothetical protein